MADASDLWSGEMIKIGAGIPDFSDIPAPA